MESQFDRPVPARVGVEAEKWDLMKPGLSPDIVPLSVADMEFASPPAIIKALEDTARSGLWGYTGWGERYFSALRGWMASRHGWDIRREWVVRVNGVVQGLNAAVRALTRPGDGIVIQPPVYPPFFRAVRDNGRTLVESPLKLENGRYEMDFDDLAEKLARPEVAALILCSPHNPVGRVWRQEELERVAALCEAHGVLIVCDEIHQDFVYAGARHIPMGTVTRAVTLTAPSKSFNLAGLQNAVAIIPDGELREKWDRFTKPLHLASGSSFGYLAGEAAYLRGGPWLDQVREIIYGNYQYLRTSLLERWPLLRIAPLEGTYLMWTDFSPYLAREEMKDFFEKECRLALNYGGQFRGGGESCVRWNLATSRELVQQAAEAVHRAMEARQAGM